MGFFYTKETKTDRYNNSYTDVRPRYGRIIGAALVLLAALIIGLSSFTIVATGHTGVVSTFGRVSSDVLQEGFHIKAPWQTVTKIDNRIIKLEVATEAFSSDLQTVTVNLAVNYRVDTSMSYSVIKNVGKEYEGVLVTPTVNEVLKSIIAQYSAEQSITNRNLISASLLDGLNEKLIATGIYVSDINIIDFDFSDTYTSAIEAKQVAEQQKLKAQIEQAQLTMEKQAEAERSIINATAAAEVSKIEAEAAAYAGEREAAANDKISASLSELLVEYYKWNRWDGKLPSVTGSNTLIGIGLDD